MRKQTISVIVKEGIKYEDAKRTARHYDEVALSMVALAGTTIEVIPKESCPGWYESDNCWNWHKSWLIFPKKESK